MAFPLLSLVPFAEKLIEKIWPDPVSQAEAQLKLAQLAQSGELAALAAETDVARGQIGVNAIEAASNRLFVAGWRPFVGWICGLSLGFKFIGGPLLVMAGQLAGQAVTLPDLGTAELMPLLIGMLGLGAMRTTEKIKGVA